MGMLQNYYRHVQYVHALRHVCSPHRCKCLESIAAASYVAQVLKHRNLRNCSALTATDRKHLLPPAVTDLAHVASKALSTIHDFVIVILIRSTTAVDQFPDPKGAVCTLFRVLGPERPVRQLTAT